jgi:hypothetical protein
MQCQNFLHIPPIRTFASVLGFASNAPSAGRSGTRPNHTALAWAWIDLLAIVYSLMGCGSGGGGGGSPAPVSPAFVTISSPSANNTTTVCDSIDFTGTAFISPKFFHCCSGSGSDTGVTVTWSNAANGQTGSANQKVDELFGILVNHTWSASVPLALGNNPVTITATDPSGLRATATATISKSANSHTLSGTLSTLGGVGIDYFSSGVKLQLSGDKTGQTTPNTTPTGAYSFTCLLDGNYAVTPNSTGLSFVFTPTSRNITIAGANVAGVDFQTMAFFLSGSITFASNGAAALAFVTVSDGTAGWTSTTSPGNYLLAAPNGIYTITPSVFLCPPSSCSFTPPNRSVVVNNADMGGLNFVEN